MKLPSRVLLFAAPWTVAHQAPPSMEFSRQEYCTGMGCHFLFQVIFLTQGLNPSLPHCRQMLYHLSHQGTSRWNSAGHNTGVDSLSCLQGIFPTQGSNPGLPHFLGILYCQSHMGSPRILEWVAYPYSRGSS